MSAALPLLLPASSLPLPSTTAPSTQWVPKMHPSNPEAPPSDEAKLQDQAMATAMARHLMDGKALKKTRPRRTVDYGGMMGRWILNQKLRPNSRYVPYIRPAPPYIIDLLLPKSYPFNLSTSLCTKFVHTSTNKIRCPVNCVAWTPEGRRVLTGSTSGEFTLWNGLTFNFETILQAHDSAIRSIVFNHAGSYLVSADQTGTIKYYQLNMNCLTEWNAHREAVRGVTFSPDDGRFASASDDSTVRIWAFEERREERVLTGHGWDVRCVQWHPTKGLLVSGSKDNLIKFWDPRTATCLTTLHQHKNTVQALAWSPDGNFLASASRDQTVRVFDIRAMKEFRIMRGHKKEVCSIAWHPVHPLLVSGGSEGSLLYWDLYSSSPSFPSPNPGSSAPPTRTQSFSTATISPRATLSQAHDSNVWALAFHPLGHILVSASNDHTTRFWSRERPGDTTSVFSGGGEKPPESMPDGEAGGADDEDDSMAVPGIEYLNEAAMANAAGQGLQWWGKDEDDILPGLTPEAVFNANSIDLKAAAGAGMSAVTGFPPSGSGLGLSFGGGGGDEGGIPGLGGGPEPPSSSRQSQLPPGFGSQEDMWAHGNSTPSGAGGYQGYQSGGYGHGSSGSDDWNSGHGRGSGSGRGRRSGRRGGGGSRY